MLLLSFASQKPQISGSCSRDLLKKGKDPFEKQLFKFMKEKKTPIKRRPFLGFKEGVCLFVCLFVCSAFIIMGF